MANGILKDWRDYPDGPEKYALYLASREWALLREAVKVRSGGICERCKSAPGENVHHQTYARKYHELLEDLVHLCRPCHAFLGARSDKDPTLDRLREELTYYMIGSFDFYQERIGFGDVRVDSALHRLLWFTFLEGARNLNLGILGLDFTEMEGVEPEQMRQWLLTPVHGTYEILKFQFDSAQLESIAAQILKLAEAKKLAETERDDNAF